MMPRLPTTLNLLKTWPHAVRFSQWNIAMGTTSDSPSLLLVLLNGDGQGRNLPDAALTQRIKALKGDIRLRTYVSLTCTNCPDVVQALNVMALLNPAISHETIDGAVCQDEVEQLNIQAVPAVYLGDELLHVGRGTLGGLLEELEDHLGVEAASGEHSETHSADLLVLGGGPAGAAAAIYAARKGQRVALVAQRIGGQVNDTTGIENIISVPMTTGAQLASDLSTHLSKYPIGIYTNRRITAVDFTGPTKRVETRGGEAFTAPQVIIATGAGWRRLGLAEEEKYIGHATDPFIKVRTWRSSVAATVALKQPSIWRESADTSPCLSLPTN